MDSPAVSLRIPIIYDQGFHSRHLFDRESYGIYMMNSNLIVGASSSQLMTTILIVRGMFWWPETENAPTDHVPLHGSADVAMRHHWSNSAARCWIMKPFTNSTVDTSLNLSMWVHSVDIKVTSFQGLISKAPDHCSPFTSFRRKGKTSLKCLRSPRQQLLCVLLCLIKAVLGNDREWMNLCITYTHTHTHTRIRIFYTCTYLYAYSEHVHMHTHILHIFMVFNIFVYWYQLHVHTYIQILYTYARLCYVFNTKVITCCLLVPACIQYNYLYTLYADAS